MFSILILYKSSATSGNSAPDKASPICSYGLYSEQRTTALANATNPIFLMMDSSCISKIILYSLLILPQYFEYFNTSLEF
jgi:hypothetical protein